MTYIRYPMLTFVQWVYATSPSCDQSYSKSAPWMMHLTLCSILQPQVTRYPMFAGLWQSGGCECGRNERIHHVRWFKSISIVQSNPCPVLLGIGSAVFLKKLHCDWKSLAPSNSDNFQIIQFDELLEFELSCFLYSNFQGLIFRHV